MKVYRGREGLTEAEVQEIEDGFLHAGFPSVPEVNAMQIGKIIRSIGFMMSYDMQQNIVAKVDIDGSGTLDRYEFRKMVRLIVQQDIDTFVLAFYEASELQDMVEHTIEPSDEELLLSLTEDPSLHRSILPGDTEFITVAQAQSALLRLGCVDIHGNVAPITIQDKIASNQVDIYGFCAAARRSRQVARAAFRKNGGFSLDDIHTFQESFIQYDADGSGELSGHEIITVLEAHFPTLANDANRRPLILQLLKEADEDGNGSLDFGDFLRLMRQAKDIQDQLMIAKELRAIEETRFSPSEVLEFRELMIAMRGESTEIGFEEVHALLGAIVPMGSKNMIQLRGMFDQVARRQAGVEGSMDKLDFPEFLWLMRELLDHNFAEIAERVAAMSKSVNLGSIGSETSFTSPKAKSAQRRSLQLF
jgi:Ca2+-binding EF-hand superfamily protein